MSKHILLRLAVFVVALVAAFPMYTAGKYYYYLGKLADSVERREAEAAREHLAEVNYYYGLAKKIPFGEYFTDKYVFSEAWYYEALYDYTIGDYDKVIKDLEGRQDYRAQHLVANSLFAKAKAEFQLADKPEKQGEIVKKVLEEINPYYDRSLRMMNQYTDPREHFKDQWNYDLTSDPASAAGALGAKGKIPIYILGIPGEGDGGPGMKGKGEEGEGEFLNMAKPQEGSPPRKKVG